MVEEQRKRVEGQMTKIVEDIDKTYLRKMQVIIPSRLDFTSCVIFYKYKKIK